MARPFCFLLCLLLAASLACATGRTGAREEIEAFNQSFASVTRGMDTPALLKLWEEDGVSLLPETAPIEGKPQIAAFIERVMASIPGARMQEFELQCRGIEVSGDWASEWCDERQIVALAGGGPPFVGVGKMLLVLHRGADGAWRLRREMWNQGVRDAAPKG